MANTILLKRSSTASDVPTAGQIAEGELAIATNPADRKLYSKDSGGTVFEIGGGSATPSTLYYNDVTARVEAQASGVAALLSDGNTDAEARQLLFEWANGTDRGRIGYVADDDLYIKNEVHSGSVILTTENSLGTQRTLLSGHADGGATGGVSIHYPAGAVTRMQTQPSGVMVLKSDGNTDAEARLLEYQWQNGTIRGDIGYAAAAPTVMAVINRYHGAGVDLIGEDVSGIQRVMFNGSPVGASGIGYTSQGIVARTMSVASGGFEVNNTLTGAGFERVLTTSDISTGADLTADEIVTGTWTLDAPVTATDFGTGGKVKDGTDVSRPVGFNVLPVYEIDANDAFDLAHNGMLWHKDLNAAVTFTCDNDATIPQGATYVVHNDDTENLTIAEGTGVTIAFLASGAAPVTGDVVLEQGGIVTVYKYSDTEFWCWGDASPPSVPATIDDLTDTNITTPADGAVLVYDTGTATWRDFILSGDASMNDSGVVVVANNSHSHTQSNISDVSATSAELNLLDLAGLTAGDVLSADTATTASWKPNSAATTLTGLTDVNITSVNDDQFLIYDAGTATWRNYDITGDMVINDVGVSTAQVSIITGKTAAGTLVSTDDFLVSDGGILAQCNLSAIQTYMQNNLTFSGGSVTSVTAGNGMVFTDITTTGAVTMGTPGTLTGATVNGVSGTSHLHTINTSGTGDIVAVDTPTFTTKINTPYMDATALGPITTPGTDDAYFGGYGMMGSRANFYVSNVVGAVALNYAGVHNSNTKLITTATGISVTGNIVVTGNVDGKDVSTLTANTGTVTAVNNGNGMNFTNISTSGTVTMGTPGSITDTSTNAVQTSSHTHAVSHTGTGNFVMAASPTFTGTAAFATITATTYSGISSGNLVDKAADEVVSGAWSVPSEILGKTASYTMILGDAGKTVRFTGATASKVCTIPANASVAYPIGTLIGVTNDGSVTMTLVITTDTLTWGKDNTTGTRTLAAGADCVIHKTTATTWKVNGSVLVT